MVFFMSIEFKSTPSGLVSGSVELPYWRGFASRLDHHSLNAYVVSLYYRMLGHGWKDLLFLTPDVLHHLTGQEDSFTPTLEYPSSFSYQTRADLAVYSRDGVLCEIGYENKYIYLYTQRELFLTNLADKSSYLELPMKTCYLLCSAGIELTEEGASVFPNRQGHVAPYKSNSAFVLPIYTLSQLLDFLV